MSANSPFDAITNNADFFIVGRPTNTATGKNKILGFSRSAADVGTVNQGDFPELSYNEAGKSVIDNAISTNPLAGTSSNLNTIYLWQTDYTQGGTISLFKNGVADGAGGTPANIGRQSFQIGDASPGNNLSDFDVAEIISFAKNLTALERNKVETYLGIKYGLTLGHDYISGAGATIWSLASSTAYNNNIFGIGREDCQGLYQKQSKSGNANALVTIGNLSIANENSLNFSAMNNAAYSVMGDDNGGLAWQTTEKPAKIEKRIAREWKVVETNTVGNILLSVPSAASSLSVKLPDPGNCKMYLLVDNDGDFSSGIIAQIPMTLNETNWEATYNFASGNYYTFATENRDYGDFPTTWPLAAASVNGCDVNNNGEYSNNDNNGTKVLVWAGNAVTSEQNAFTNDDDADDDGLIFPSAVFLPGATYNFTVLLNSNIPNTTVYYRVWFDWDNNGSFSNDNDGNGSPATFAGSTVVAGTAAKQVTFSVKLPAAASQLSKMRLIVSDAAIADLYRPASSPAYQFFLTNGEVEDYSAPLSVLPVKLGKFEVAVKNCSASLSWQTLSEENLKQFEIQFSTDGQNFDNLATILAKDIPSGASYNALAAIAEGNNYFRLKMLNGDGSYTYSTVQYVKSICKNQKIVISPNPVQNHLLVSGLVKNSVLIISDAMGRIVLQIKTGESTTKQINTHQFPVGLYTLRVMGNNVQAGAYKFLKTK